MPKRVLAFKNVSLEPFDNTSDAVLVEDGVIVAVGAWADIADRAGSRVPVVDGGGCTLLPGIEDSHLHGYMFGRQLSGVNLTPQVCPDLASVNLAIAQYAQNTDGWIRGFGWVRGELKGSGPEGTPCTADLEASGVSRPMVLTDFSGHQALCNAQALKLAGITANTPDPSGGLIIRDKSGNPTGLLVDSAVQLVTRLMPPPSAAEIRNALQLVRDSLLATGVTSFVEPGLGPGAKSLDDGTASLAVLDGYRAMEAAGELNLRVTVMLLFGGLGGTTLQHVAEGLDAFGSPESVTPGRLVSVSQLKLFADGIPRSRTSWISDPYDNCEHGSLTLAGGDEAERLETLEEIYDLAVARGWQLGIHATGDRTINAVLDAAAKNPGGRSLRNYLIHGDLAKPKDISRLREQGIGLTAQPGIRWMVGSNAASVLGAQRANERLPLQAMASAGVALSLSTDAPVTTPDWRHVYATARTRGFVQDPAFDDGQALTAMQAMRALTADSAFLSHGETWRGQIRPSMVADLVLLDRRVEWDQDPWAVTKVNPRAVYLAGNLVFGAA